MKRKTVPAAEIQQSNVMYTNAESALMNCSQWTQEHQINVCVENNFGLFDVDGMLAC